MPWFIFLVHTHSIAKVIEIQTICDGQSYDKSVGNNRLHHTSRANRDVLTSPTRQSPVTHYTHGGKYTVQTDQRLSSSVCHSAGGGSLGRHTKELFRFCLGLAVCSLGPGDEGISELSGGNAN